MMRRFFGWLTKVSPEITDREKVDAAIFLALSSPSGKVALDYLIAAHYAMVTPPTMLDQAAYNEGRRFVIQDILDSIDRYRNGNPELKTETTQ